MAWRRTVFAIAVSGTVAALFAAMGHKTAFLARRWRGAPPGLGRFEALCGLLYAGLSLTGMGKHVAPALRALDLECLEQIDAEGGLPTRNPEELMEVFALLTWVAQALDGAERSPGPEHGAALARIVPTLRALKHADGGLARFHGGGRGVTGRLDQALAAVHIRPSLAPGRAMGFARLAAGRTTVLVDAAPPPTGAASLDGHASTLAFELTSGRRPVIVNCGSGAEFGETWRRAGRATQSHSTLCIDGASSSRLVVIRGAGDGAEELTDVPRDVRVQRLEGTEGQGLMVGHDGYVDSHGLTHVRRLTLSRDGRALTGEDTLGALTESDRERFEAQLNESGLVGVAYSIRFHLHPDVDAQLDMSGNAVSLRLRSGEVWVLRNDGSAKMSIETSVYLDSGRLKPRGARQIVLTDKVSDFARQIGWTLAKA
ncbi:MAG: heparinase II/III-family protein, partial [Pseudomonadota bacterium]